jgi:hypothetical protein
MKAVASLAAGVAVSLLLNTPAFAQGKSQDHGKGGGNGAAASSGKNAGGKGGDVVSSPSQTPLAAPASVTSATSAATPFAWIDNANLMAPGAVWIGMSAVRWQNAGVSEISFPVVDAAVGLNPRVQLGASVPRVVGRADIVGNEGGMGTTFLNAKIGVLNDSERPLKMAVTPTVEVLGRATLQWLPAGQSRLQWGLPVSAEFDHGASRVYGSTGYFSPGIWYTGVGAGSQIVPRVGVAVSLSRAWSRAAAIDPALGRAARNDISTGVSVDVTPNVGVFGSVGRTLKTSPQFGAGTTASIGIALTAEKISFKP